MPIVRFDRFRISTDRRLRQDVLNTIRPFKLLMLHVGRIAGVVGN